jgi:hypothetical protein
MRTQNASNKGGSVLVTAILTLTILSMICALSLYVTAQNTNSTSQTASWQAALSGAESGVEHAYYALNKSNWTGWKTVAGTLPTTQPTGGSTTTTAPASGQYAYYTRTMQLTGEGANSVKFWTTVDTAGLPKDKNGNQWFRIRATGLSAAPGPQRVSNQKRDNDLRRISLRTDRMTGLAVSTPQAARTIEVIAQPITTSIWTRGITLKGPLSMNGATGIDSFDSGNILYSVNHLYDFAHRRTHGDVGVVDSTGSNLGNADVWGSVAYSGPAIKKAGNVHGAISTPFQTTIPDTVAPNWASGTYTSLPGGNPPVPSVTSGTASNPTLVKINGNVKLTGGSTFTINAANSSATDNAVIIWVVGNFEATGNSKTIIQDPKVKVTWYVDGDIKVAGTSYQNAGGYASQVNFIGLGNHTATVTGTGDFIGTINAPGFDLEISGTGAYVGAIIGKSLTIKGTGDFHYDEALASNGNSGAVGNFSYASWFEDIADVPRGATY